MALPEQLAILADRIRVPDVSECGPAMKALTENQRRYVCALGVFGNHKTAAYEWAFGCQTNSANAAAPRLGKQDKIKRAITEYYQDDLHIIGPALAAVRILEALGPENTDLKLALKAVDLASNIVPGFKAATVHELTVKHEYSLAELEERAARLTEALKLPELPAPNIIEAEYEEVDPDLADIL